MALLSRSRESSATAGTGASGRRLRLCVGVLGGLRLSLGDAPLVLTNRKARGLLAYLAIEPATSVERERLAGLFWGEVGERQARNSLRQAIFEMREALEPQGCLALRVSRDAISLQAEHLHVDLHELFDAVAAGSVPDHLLSRQGGCEQLLATYEDLSPLFAEWLAAARRGMQDRLLRALERGFGDTAGARRQRRLMAEAALRLDPLHEGACRVVMRLAAEEGEVGASLRCYAALYERLGAELDMEPSLATQQLVADIKRGEFDAANVPAGAPAPAAKDGAGGTGRRAMLVPGDAPLLAILPLRPSGPEALPDYLAEGIVEDIIAILAGLREPAVISANSTRRLKGSDAEDVVKAGAALGADYVVTGSLRVAGGRAHLSIELAETSQGAVLWARAFHTPMGELFETQAEIAARIASTLAPRVNEAELRASRQRRPDDLGAYHLLLRARDRMFQLEPGPLAEAGTLLRRAAGLDPDYAPIHGALMDWHSLRIFQGWSDDREADTQALEDAARRALRLDPGNARALALWGHHRTIIHRHYDEALDLLERAIAAAPSDAETVSWTAPTLAYVGHSAEAILRAERALALSPYDPFLFRYEHFLSIAHYAAGDLEAAASWGMRSASRNPNYTSNLRIVAAALGGLGRAEEAAPVVRRLLTLQPGLRVGPSLGRYAFRDAAQRQRHAAYLLKAGIPD